MHAVVSIGHLGSTQASTRGGALGLVKALSSQSSDSGPVQDMAKQLLTALKGNTCPQMCIEMYTKQCVNDSPVHDSNGTTLLTLLLLLCNTMHVGFNVH